MNKFLRNTCLVFVAVALMGCNNEKVRSLIDMRTDDARRGLQAATNPGKTQKYDPLVVTDQVWAGSVSMRMRRGLPLPSRFETARGITIVSGKAYSMEKIATMITRQTGIPVRIAPGTDTIDGNLKSRGRKGQELPDMPIAYEGPLSALLDQVAGFYGIIWKYDGASINLARFETRVFTIEALPGVQTVEDGVDEMTTASNSTTAGDTSSSTNDIQQTSQMAMEFRSWEELKETLEALTNGIGKVVISPSSGTVTVTTTPAIMQTVAKYIEEENRRLSRQIAINVEVYAVSLSEGTDFNVAFSETLKKIADIEQSFDTASGPTTITGGGTFNLAILNSEHTGQVSAVFTALSSLGDTTRVAQFPMTTLNNRTVTRRVGRDHTYAATVSSSNTDSYTSTSVDPGTIQEGFSLQVTPRLLDDGRILLQYSLSLVDIISITNFTSDDTTIQLPETATRLFVQQSLLRSGSTLVIGGYDDEQAEQSTQGVGSPFNYLLGGGSSNSTSRTMMFISITPQVLDVAGMEQS